MYFLPITAKELTHERWDLVTAYLEGKEERYCMGKFMGFGFNCLNF